MGSRKNNQWCQEEQKRNRLDKIWKSQKKKKRATSPKLIGCTPKPHVGSSFIPIRSTVSADPPLHPASEEFICGSNL